MCVCVCVKIDHREVQVFLRVELFISLIWNNYFFKNLLIKLLPEAHVPRSQCHSFSPTSLGWGHVYVKMVGTAGSGSPGPEEMCSRTVWPWSVMRMQRELWRQRLGGGGSDVPSEFTHRPHPSVPALLAHWTQIMSTVHFKFALLLSCLQLCKWLSYLILESRHPRSATDSQEWDAQEEVLFLFFDI